MRTVGKPAAVGAIRGYKQGDDEPAVCLSWNDARAYADWLSHETGRPYRLPTAAEMEYAIRAGSSTPYPWGSAAEDVCEYGNVRDVNANTRFPKWKTGVTCNDGALFTSAVGRYRANAFGLFDTVGNVEVWTEDCGVDNYNSAPSDGSAQRSPGCERRTLRGSSWNFSPTDFRSAHRENPPPACQKRGQTHFHVERFTARSELRRRSLDNPCSPPTASIAAKASTDNFNSNFGAGSG